MINDQLTKAQQVERAITAQWKTIKGVVPDHVTPERLVRIAVSAIGRNDTLSKCSVSSLVEAVTQAGIVGLEPNDGTGRAYILPYKGQAAFQIGYKGLLDLAYRSGRIALVDAQVVYEGEPFECRLGTAPYLEHTPTFDHGPMVGVYAVVRVKGVEYPLIEMMGPDELKRIKAASQASRADSPWRIWEEEMSRKAVLKRVLKRAPSDTALRLAVGMIDAADAGIPVEDIFPGQSHQERPEPADKLAALTAKVRAEQVADVPDGFDPEAGEEQYDREPGEEG